MSRCHRRIRPQAPRDHTAEATLSSSEASPAYDDALAKIQAEGSFQARPKDEYCRHLEQGVHTLTRPGNTGRAGIHPSSRGNQHDLQSPECLADFQQKTKDDATLQQLKQTIQLGWPDRKDASPIRSQHTTITVMNCPYKMKFSSEETGP